MAEGHPSQRIHPGSIRADQGEGRRSLPTVANRGEGGGGLGFWFGPFAYLLNQVAIQCHLLQPDYKHIHFYYVDSSSK